MHFELIQTGFLHGFILAFVVFSLMIPFRFLNLPDLTAEGAYPLGGTVSACLLLAGVNAFFAIGIAIFLSGLLGLLTAYLHLRFKTPTLLVGIILTTMTYSLNLRLMGQPNLAIFKAKTFFHYFNDSLSLKIAIMSTLILLSCFAFYQFLNTEKGLRFRAVGLNPLFAQRQSVGLKRTLFLGFFIANAFAGAAGSFISQLQGYMDINMGIGIVIHALAALMLGECLIGNETLLKQTAAALVGALVYQQIQGIALSAGLQPTDLKLFTGGIVLFLMMIRRKMPCPT